MMREFDEVILRLEELHNMFRHELNTHGDSTAYLVALETAIRELEKLNRQGIE